MRDLRNRVVVVTGPTSGVGRAAAVAFARAGAHVVLGGRSEGKLVEVAAECRAHGVEVVSEVIDVTVEEDVRRLADAALAAFGRIDVWVNNASVYLLGRLDETPIDVQRRLLETNVLGYLHGIAAVVPHFRARGQGILIQVGSVAGKAAYAYAGAYAASKHAVMALSDTLRQELRGSGVEVVTIVPASIDTPLFHHTANFAGRAVRPMPPIYDPERIAAAIVGAARRPRREVVIGVAPRALTLFRRLLPALYERLLPRLVARAHFEDAPAPGTTGNVFATSPHREVTGGWRRGRGRAALAVAAFALPLAALAVRRPAARRLLAAST